MNNIQFWEFVHENLQDGEPLMLLLVVESGGSSPGRAGFKMAVTAAGRSHGTIGGGVMEKELAEQAAGLLARGTGAAAAAEAPAPRGAGGAAASVRPPALRAGSARAGSASPCCRWRAATATPSTRCSSP